MTTQDSPGKCPVCGTELPINAPQGLCPKCLLQGVAAATEPGTEVGARPAPPALEAIRAAFPQLEIIELIGQGGMGAVFKARQPKLNRFVALKILPERMSAQPAFAERFAREAQMLARLNHPNIVTVHDFGQAGEFFYLLMEYVDGVNLRQAMGAGRFTPEQALAIVPMICEALQYAHDEGVLHRDVKPENILLDTKGRVRLVDFGIAKLAAGIDVGGPSVPERPQDSALTQSGTALGTPNYMAPEQQLDPSTVDRRADIYSLGVVFYEMLTGELPANRIIPPSRRTPMDPRVDEIVMRAIARQKEKRFATADAVRTSVEAIAGAPRPVIPAMAKGHPTPLSRVLKMVLLAELGAIMVLTAGELINSATFFTRHLRFILFNGGWVQGSVAAVGFALVGWLARVAWRRRDWLLAPFRDVSLWDTPDSKRFIGRWNVDESLRTACVAYLAVLGIQILWLLMGDVVMVAQGVANGNWLLAASVILPLGVSLLPIALGVLLVVYLIRRERQRDRVIEPAAPPKWLPRMAVLLLAVATISLLPVPRGEVHMVAINFGAVFAVAALPLLTRSRLWRAIALGVLIQLLYVSFTGLVLFCVMAARGNLPAEWWNWVGPVRAVTLGIGMQFLSVFCDIAGLTVLLLPDVAAAFGIPRHANVSPGTPSRATA